jgi:hypothetical protein
MRMALVCDCLYPHTVGAARAVPAPLARSAFVITLDTWASEIRRTARPLRRCPR